MSLRSIEQLFLERPSNRFFMHNDHLPYRTLARKKKKSVLYELGNEVQLGVYGACEPLSGFSRGVRGDVLGKSAIFILQLVQYSLLEIIKLIIYLLYL